MAKIFVSMPILGKPELKSIYSLYISVLSCGEHQIRLYLNENDSLISRVRNAHLSVFYNDYPECDYFMSIDSDIEILNCHPTNNIFDKLVGHNLDFVGGLYAIKKPGEIRSSSIAADGEPPEFNSGLKEMRWLSSGCWCISRSMVGRMVKSYPELEYDGDDNMSKKKMYGLYIPQLYDLKKDDLPGVKIPFRKYLSEDWSFCERWKKIGGNIYADTSIILNHIGKHDYNLFNVEMVVRERPAAPPPGFELEDK